MEELQADGSVVARTIRGTALVHRGVAEILGNARPFLDLRYLDLIFRDGFELPGGTGAGIAVPGSR